MLGTPTQRLALYVVAAAAFLSAPVAEANREQSTPAVTQEFITQQGADSTDNPAALVSPFAQDEVVFRSSPDAWVLLLGKKEESVVARALWRGGCDDIENIVMIPRSGQDDAREVHVANADYFPIDTGVSTDGDASSATGPWKLQDKASPPPSATVPCPVTLTAPQMTVGERTRGWLIRPGTTLAPEQLGDVEKLITEYRVVRIISGWGYLLLGTTALLVTVASWGVQRVLIERGSRDDWEYTKRTANQEPNLDALPVVTGAVGALAAVTTGALAWSDLAPDLHLGGIVVIALTAGLMVALGSATQGQPGLFAGVLGLALIALLVPFALLHGATIGGCWPLLIWVVVTCTLAAAVGWAASRPKTSKEG